ncbi:MAG TPA: hypothetical protein VHX63_13095 [Acidobacteriaceae bacterium]|jgi:hypothetical protein|nr:hypothetical protein [Acidobacteriaceae bacterium]
MAYTNNCDLYAAVQEDGINLVAQHVMRQRPSWFNFATQYVSDHPQLACTQVAHTIDVTDYGNPLFNVVSPVPILGADSPPLGLNFCAQLVKAEVDFYPGNLITLPAALNPPLPKQHLAMHVQICGGMDCPSEFIKGFLPAPSQYGEASNVKQQQELVPPTRELLCFCLDAYLVAHVVVQTVAGKPSLVGIVDSVDVAGIKPKGLSDNINCYLKTTFELLLREKLIFPISTMLFDIPLLSLATITAQLTPNPPIPNNPAIEDNQLKVFVSLTVAP